MNCNVFGIDFKHTVEFSSFGCVPRFASLFGLGQLVLLYSVRFSLSNPAFRPDFSIDLATSCQPIFSCSCRLAGYLTLLFVFREVKSDSLSSSDPQSTWAGPFWAHTTVSSKVNLKATGPSEGFSLSSGSPGAG